tara:strand:+ start:2220 stop:2594 length:375 start_codon:yes stop_codon:yes gene_type:complete
MTDFLLLAFVFLIAGVVAVPIASRLGLGSVLGYLIAGIVISPFLAWLHVDVISIQHFAEFGVVMMLFLVGLELEPKLLWSMRAKLFGLGGDGCCHVIWPSMDCCFSDWFSDGFVFHCYCIANLE